MRSIIVQTYKHLSGFFCGLGCASVIMVLVSLPKCLLSLLKGRFQILLINLS